jgi:hypothetical protein
VAVRQEKVDVLQILQGEIAVSVDVSGGIIGLPEPAEGVGFIVSRLVRETADRDGRIDLFSPGELIRNVDGQPIGCKGLVCNF